MRRDDLSGWRLSSGRKQRCGAMPACSRGSGRSKARPLGSFRIALRSLQKAWIEGFLRPRIAQSPSRAGRHRGQTTSAAFGRKVRGRCALTPGTCEPRGQSCGLRQEPPRTYCTSNIAPAPPASRGRSQRGRTLPAAVYPAVFQNPLVGGLSYRSAALPGPAACSCSPSRPWSA